MSSSEAEVEFANTLNNLLEMVEKLSEGDYIRSANMLKDLMSLKNELKGSVHYVYLTRHRREVYAMSNEAKLASNKYFTCSCGIVVSREPKKIDKHNWCKTHIRSEYQNKLKSKGYSDVKIEETLARYCRQAVNDNDYKWKCIRTFIYHHIQKVKEQCHRSNSSDTLLD